MIEFKQGNLLKSNLDALVNPVNCVGIMGKGLGLQFKQKFPENFLQYKDACDRQFVKLGQMYITKTGNLFPRYIINFPTKYHWKDSSNIHSIQLGLKSLVKQINDLKICSIAIPSLGCGNGGLEWEKVKPIILNYCSKLSPDIKIEIFEPLTHN